MLGRWFERFQQAIARGLGIVISAPKESRMAFSSSVEFWRNTFEQEAPDVPINFLLSWIQHESGGNPCSLGFAGEQHPDGLFKMEAGIGQQFYSARTRAALNDVAVNGVPLRVLRAPCSGQTATRALTEDERVANVRAFLGDVERFRAKAHEQLSAVGSQANDEQLEDFWMFVKLRHGLPSIAIELLKPAAESGAADSFGRFRGFIEGLSPAELQRIAPISARFAFKGPVFVGLTRILNNAEKTGKGAGVSFFDFVPDAGNLTVLFPPLALLVGLALLKGGLA